MTPLAPLGACTHVRACLLPVSVCFCRECHVLKYQEMRKNLLDMIGDELEGANNINGSTGSGKQAASSIPNQPGLQSQQAQQLQQRDIAGRGGSAGNHGGGGIGAGSGLGGNAGSTANSAPTGSTPTGVSAQNSANSSGPLPASSSAAMMSQGLATQGMYPQHATQGGTSMSAPISAMPTEGGSSSAPVSSGGPSMSGGAGMTGVMQMFRMGGEAGNEQSPSPNNAMPLNVQQQQQQQQRYMGPGSLGFAPGGNGFGPRTDLAKSLEQQVRSTSFCCCFALIPCEKNKRLFFLAQSRSAHTHSS